ncbi:MAG: acireductone synthase [Gammaproteobacteria bacterium]|nr:acireductone synthase [Gammaproteobacteria bacterium]NBT43973.1 acireductone synthase [Gammaproteobacteria bacterium]NBY22914.1 acireductone synthase [Gammaproteobacteria bacterium]NDE34202.1 acireductone synthase [Gammaproteobacteria bacterium]NDE56179.1 acireductone synthase [Gammaproteobacteria bacterium]
MIDSILTDIEGTTSSLSFVRDVLFPYSRAHLPAFIKAHAQDPLIQKELEAINQLKGAVLSQQEALDQLLTWIDQDQKVTPLKALQGLIWEAGYEQGDFHGHLYEDAARMLKVWASQGFKLYVFSSGSIKAQKLLFGHTEEGDLSPLFSDFFDTRIGSKQDPEAYRAIARATRQAASNILFLSDIGTELDAARAAGMATTQLIRENQPIHSEQHAVAKTFDDIVLQ